MLVLTYAVFMNCELIVFGTLLSLYVGKWPSRIITTAKHQFLIK